MLNKNEVFLYPNAIIDYDGEQLNIYQYLQKSAIVIESGFSLANCKLMLRPVGDLGPHEKKFISELLINPQGFWEEWDGKILKIIYRTNTLYLIKLINFLRKICIDIDGFIESGKAISYVEPKKKLTEKQKNALVLAINVLKEDDDNFLEAQALIDAFSEELTETKK
jgi:hypothetical protein